MSEDDPVERAQTAIANLLMPISDDPRCLAMQVSFASLLGLSPWLGW